MNGRTNGRQQAVGGKDRRGDARGQAGGRVPDEGSAAIIYLAVATPALVGAPPRAHVSQAAGEASDGARPRRRVRASRPAGSTQALAPPPFDQPDGGAEKKPCASRRRPRVPAAPARR